MKNATRSVEVDKVEVRPFQAPEDFERMYVRPNAGRTLIVGSYVTEGKADRRARYADVVGVDMRPGPGVDIVQDMEATSDAVLAVDGFFDHVECLSVLEHSPRPWLLAGTLQLLMKPGATLHFSVPFVWRVHAHPSDYWRMTIEAVRVIFPGIDWKTLMYGDIGLHAGGKSPAVRHDGNLYMARAETLGFGVRL